MVERATPEVIWPDWFDHSEELLWEAKGRFEADIRLGDRVVAVSFIDPARLAQDVASELSQGSVPFFRYLVVVPKITRQIMQSAVERVAKELR